MVVPVSSLSLAIQGVADYLDAELGSEVSVSVDSPQQASETAKNSNTTHILNLFVYRVAPSGFHPELTARDPVFLRLYALLTPFRGAIANQAEDAEHRILGAAIRVLSSNPVLPTVLPGPGVAADGAQDFRNDPETLSYRIQAVMQAPSMEELNHIWTTQGAELAYRLSAAYEFSLVPVEPMERAPVPPEIRSALLDIGARPHRDRPDGVVDFGEHVISIPADTVDWLPVVLAVADGGLSTLAEVTPATGTLDVAVAGKPGEEVALEVVWFRAGDPATPAPQAAQIRPVTVPLVSSPAALTSITLDAPAAGDRAVIHARPAAGGAAVPGAPEGNTVELQVTP